MKNWFHIYTTRDLPKANILKGMLEENSIPAMLINKQSSTYIMFGEIELYVPSHLKEAAKELLNEDVS